MGLLPRYLIESQMSGVRKALAQHTILWQVAPLNPRRLNLRISCRLGAAMGKTDMEGMSASDAVDGSSTGT
jgi:hypothetical protein